MKEFRDINVAASFLCLPGITLIGSRCERQGKYAKVWFMLEGKTDAEFEALTYKFSHCDLMVDARTVSEKANELRDIIRKEHGILLRRQIEDSRYETMPPATKSILEKTPAKETK